MTRTPIDIPNPRIDINGNELPADYIIVREYSTANEAGDHTLANGNIDAHIKKRNVDSSIYQAPK